MRPPYVPRSSTIYCDVGIGKCPKKAYANIPWNQAGVPFMMLPPNETIDSMRQRIDQDDNLQQKILCSKVGKDMFLFGFKPRLRG